MESTPAVSAGATPSSSGTASSDSLMLETSQSKFGSAGYGVPQSTYSYSENASGSSMQPHQQSSFVNQQNLHPTGVQPVSGLSLSGSGSGFTNNHQFQSSTHPGPGYSPGGKNTPPSSVAFLQSLPQQSVHPNSFITGTTAMSVPPKGALLNAASFSSWMPADPSFPVPPRLPGTPSAPAPPGLAPSAPASNLTVPSAGTDTSLPAVSRPTMQTFPTIANPSVQHQLHPSYPYFPARASFHQGPWLQPPQMGGMPRPPFMQYPSVFPGSYPVPAIGMPLPSVPLPASQPPGVTPVVTSGSIPKNSGALGQHLAGSSAMETDVPPPGIDSSKHVNDVPSKDGALVNKQLDAWTAHKTETGIVYYYNALTGESTYKKPSGFNGESDKVLVEPTSVSGENLAGTDWATVTTSDGKTFYYNSKTKVSSWQIPSEATEVKKQQGGDVLEPSMSVPNTNVLTEKGSGSMSLSAPALNTGGRDSTALRTSGVMGSTSALDLVKKKLQDYGSPITSSPTPALSGTAAVELNGSRAFEATVQGLQSENSTDKLKNANGDTIMSDSSSDSEDKDSGLTNEECVIQFKEMLKERGVAPFSKWEKELPKILFDPRFKAIPSYSTRRSLFEHYVKTRAEEERKEKRASQKAAIEGFKQLLEQASEDIDQNTDYRTFRKKWGDDPRFEALDRKDREFLLNERVFPLKRAAQEKVKAARAAAANSFKSMLQEKGDITLNSRWSKVKDSLRDDTRYRSVKHEEREILFNEYLSELRSAEKQAESEAKAKRDEQDKLKEREREIRKRKEREELEMERVRMKVRRKEAVASYQALLTETIKDPQASWIESKPKLEKDPQGRATNPGLDQSELENLFREHIKMLHERCTNEFKAMLAELMTAEAAAQETEDGKTVVNSWSTAKRLLKPDPRYNKMPRKDREALWRRHADEMLRKQKSLHDHKDNKHTDTKPKTSVDSGRLQSGLRRTSARR